ncbi:MAG: hypothetical protein J07HQX50_02282 [Haloquadratum sp. J07HQX50]|nr:MAG: hypothetical protein J07HQX50_02282 [Haloquadratum sp. J07HQX50]
MDCPRCEIQLTIMSLGGEHEVAYCDDCGFADIESDHLRVSQPTESWDDAFERFDTVHHTNETTEHRAHTEDEESSSVDLPRLRSDADEIGKIRVRKKADSESDAQIDEQNDENRS